MLAALLPILAHASPFFERGSGTPSAQAAHIPVSVVPISDARTPQPSIAALIPKPKIAILDYGKPATITSQFSFPAGVPRYWSLFAQMLGRRFEAAAASRGIPPLKVDGGVSRMHFQPGGYTLDITPTSVSVLGEEEEGLRNAIYRLAQLAFVKNGHLLLPTGHLEDEPHAVWRGVHLFGGPEAREFQNRLWDRVLLPLGMNKAVIQCERTAWDSTPLDASMHPMSKGELAGLFDDYRRMGVEPIPLIQSLGHMQWFFAGKRRLDLAVNSNEPFTLDSRKKQAKDAIDALWNEAIDLLKPSAVHFGADEIGLVGMTPPDPELITDLWRAQMSNFGAIARRHGVQMMIWGDEGLAPGEAVDATSGDSAQEASNRRAAIPAGTVVCDWHYIADPDPVKYYPALQLWKREGLRPLASTWYQPENIRGFDLAANLEHVGVLQTTWAGYESSERAMIENDRQFTAMVLAADYSWSDRQESADKLGYDPALVFRQMYFGEPVPVVSHPGQSFQWASPGRSVHVGNTSYRLAPPLRVAPAGRDAPVECELRPGSSPSGTKIAHLAFAVDTPEPADDGKEVATVTVQLAKGAPVTRRLVYGHHLRAASDLRMTPYADRGEGLCGIQIDFGRADVVRSITFRAGEGSGGLRIFGATGW